MKPAYGILIAAVLGAFLVVGCGGTGAGGGDGGGAGTPDITVLRGASSISSGDTEDLGTHNDSSDPGPNDTTFTIRNDGDSELQLTVPLSIVQTLETLSGNPLTPNGEIIIFQEPSDAIDPGNTTSFIARLEWQTGGGAKADAAVTITSNDPDEGSFQLNLTGYVFS